MKIAEHFKEEIFEIAKKGDRVGVTKTGKITSCSSLSCNQCIGEAGDSSCNDIIGEYLNREYCPFEKDEIVEVSDDNIDWRIRHFASISDYADSPYIVYAYGYSSKDNGDTMSYKYCRKYGTLGEFEKQIPRKPEMIVTDYGVLTEFKCSACGTIHRANDTKGLNKCKYCSECGTKIDWGGKEYE